MLTKENIELVLAFCAGIVAVFAFIKKIIVPLWKKMRSGMSGAMALIRLADQGDRIIKVLDKIQSELLPNGGKTLRDSLTRIEKSISTIEEDSKLSKEKFASFFEITDSGLWESDKTGLFVRCNRAMCAIIGLSSERMAGFGWLLAIKENERDHVQEEWKSSVESRREFSMQFHIEKENGTVFKILAVAIPIKSASGEVSGYLGKCRVLEGV